MKLRRDISTWELLMTSLSAMIGSGWLFGSMYAAQIAGPAAIYSWVIGGILLIIIGLNYAELATALPLSGGIVRYTHITHGGLMGFSSTWLAWLSCVATGPTEAQAILQYSAHYLPWQIYISHHNNLMTVPGWITAIVLLFFFTLINFYVLKLVIRFNNLMTYWKLFIPILVIICIASTYYNTKNYNMYGGFTPYGFKNVLWAIPTAGVIFSFLGFRECISMAGETKNPSRSIPIALIGSIIICTILYIALQITLLGSLTPNMLANGWSGLTTSIQTGPLASIALILGMTWLVKIIYIDAILSPIGTGVIYTATTARLNYGASINKYLPEFMSKVNRKGVPIFSVLINFIVGIIMLVPLRTWQELVAFQSTAIVLSYGIGPICLKALRKTVPNLKRPFVLCKSTVISVITFYICTLVAYWTGWDTVKQTGCTIIIGLFFMGLYRICSKRGKSYDLSIKHYLWFILYIVGLTLISWLGSFGHGKNYISFGWDFVIIGVFSAFVFWLALCSSHSTETVLKILENDHEYQDYAKQSID